MEFTTSGGRVYAVYVDEAYIEKKGTGQYTLAIERDAISGSNGNERFGRLYVTFSRIQRHLTYPSRPLKRIDLEEIVSGRRRHAQAVFFDGSNSIFRFGDIIPEKCKLTDLDEHCLVAVEAPDKTKNVHSLFNISLKTCLLRGDGIRLDDPYYQKWMNQRYSLHKPSTNMEKGISIEEGETQKKQEQGGDDAGGVAMKRGRVQEDLDGKSDTDDEGVLKMIPFRGGCDESDEEIGKGKEEEEGKEEEKEGSPPGDICTINQKCNLIRIELLPLDTRNFLQMCMDVAEMETFRRQELEISTVKTNH